MSAKFKVILDQDFSETERGNVWLYSSEDGDHSNAWLKVGPDLRLAITIRPENYPGLTVNLVQISDFDLARHIRRHFGGIYAKSLNLDVAWALEAVRVSRPLGMNPLIPYSPDEFEVTIVRPSSLVKIAQVEAQFAPTLCKVAAETITSESELLYLLYPDEEMSDEEIEATVARLRGLSCVRTVQILREDNNYGED